MIEDIQNVWKVFCANPLLLIQYILYQLICMFVPGTYGSKFFADKAMQIQQEMDVIIHGVESRKFRQNRLIKEYERIASTRFTKEEHLVVQDLISFTKRVDTDAGTERIQAILSLPTRRKEIRADVEGARLLKVLEAYPMEVRRSVYNYVAISAVAFKRGISLPKLPPLFFGASGTGKTHLCTEIGNALGITASHLVLGQPGTYVWEQMFGRKDMFCNNGDPLGAVVRAIVEQKVKQYPILVYLDEIDKFLNDTNLAMTNKMAILDLFNNEKTKIKCEGIGGLDLDLNNIWFIMCANEPVYATLPFKGNDTDKPAPARTPDLAFADRVALVSFPSVTPEMKQKIGESIVADTLREFGMEAVSAETRARLDEIIQTDKSPGVRQLKNDIVHTITYELAAQDGWIILK